MALTREFIRKLAKESDVELPKEFLDGIIAEHTSARDAYADEQVKAELAKAQTGNPVNVKDSEEYKTLKKSFDDYKAEIAAKEAKAAKEAAFRAILKDANLSERGIEKALKYAEWDKIELEADGKVKGAADHIKAIKADWAEYVTTTTVAGANTSNPPANAGSGTGKTREEIIAIKDGSIRRAEMTKNAHLFPEMAAENNTILQGDVVARVVDFNIQFVGNLNKLTEALGVTRKIAVQEGAALKQIKVTGTLLSGNVAEGELIPLSKYEAEEVAVGEVKLNKWRKGTTAEAILKGGYDQAVGATTDKMVRDIQKTIRGDLFSYMATGTGTASGNGLQAALANAWGKLAVLFEDDAVETAYFLNPMDVADYLGSAQVEMQTVFGMNYIKNFLGLGDVFLNSNVPEGKFYATAKENIVLYYVNVASGEIAAAFGLTADETGYIGINEYADKDTARVIDLVMSGVTFFPERLDGIVVGTIAGA